jgi:hypothetical protein
VGTVRDQNTRAPIDHATVYFSSTSNGVFTDQSGKFEIDVSNYRGMPLAVSALGYYSNEVPKPDPEKNYTILLAPKTYELNEVVVEAKGRAYKAKFRRNMDEFRKQFLGTTINAQKCEILNESALYFSSHDNILIAYSFKPLEIINNGLGFKITYFLDRFEYEPDRHTVVIRGDILFEDLKSNYSAGKADWFEKRRNTAYLGSRMHFFRCLWGNTLDSSGFELKSEINEKLLYKNIVFEDKQDTSEKINKYLNYDGVIKICYFSKNPTSSVTCITHPVYFEKSGYFEPLDVSWSGEISVQRIGDLLPFDYKFLRKRN